jgi:hypothetical protein
MQVDDRPGLDDPIWEHVLKQRLLPYLDTVREWWKGVEDFSMIDTGMMELECETPGLYVRFTRTAIRSPIRGIQAFPFVPTARLQISGIQGGSTKMIDRVCLNNKMKIDEFTIICKSNLPSTFNASQFVAFIPTELLESKMLGIWLYFTQEELSLLAQGKTNEAIRHKALLKA